jgi:pseudooxynicotine dehydrogenase
VKPTPKPTARSRREFVRGVSMALAASTFAQPSSTRAAEVAGERTAPADRYDAIVVGAGFAGVTAARELSWRGLSTLLLEARPRPGGRTFTTPKAGHDVEMGGTWVGWLQPHVWSEITRYSLSLAESASAAATRAIWMDQGKRIDGDMQAYAALMEPMTNAFYGPAAEAFPRPYDPLFKKGLEKLDATSAAAAIERLNLPPVQKGLALSFAGINGHSSPDASSYLDQLRWYALGGLNIWRLWDNLARYRIDGGTRSLIDRMQADSRAVLKLESPVAAVSQQEGGVVTVVTRDGTKFSARAAVVAVPLNCVVDIDFSPALSATKQRVSRARHTGSGTKVYARIKTASPIFLGHGTHDMPLNFLWTEYDDRGSQLLVGFGPSPKLLDIADERAVREAVRAFVPDAELLEFFGHDWNSDPWSRGTWCMYRPGVLTGDLRELQRSEGNVHFCGSDIANGWRGFIDGAIESGLRVGRDVADRLA